MPRNPIVFSILLLILASYSAGNLSLVEAAEVVSISEKNWQEFAPQGKEADWIYGDYALRNDKIVAVIADPVRTRNANMTVRNVGAMLIDLTERNTQSDQLSAFYPAGSQVSFCPPGSFEAEIANTFSGEGFGGTGRTPINQPMSGKRVSIAFQSQVQEGKPQVKLTYSLEHGKPYLSVDTAYTNVGEKAIEFELRDAMRADRTFVFGEEQKRNLFWAYDEWFRQAYGVVVSDHVIKQSGGRGILLQYLKVGSAKVTLDPKASYSVSRKVMPARDLLGVLAIANQIAGQSQKRVALHVKDKTGAVDNARVTLTKDGKTYGWARTSQDGQLAVELAAGSYEATVHALGRPVKKLTIDPAKSADYNVELDNCGYVNAKINDEQGGPIPCKVEFVGVDGTASPNFGPDSRAVTTKNLHYSHDGSFRQEIGPGKYQVIISHGPEFDAVFTTIEVARGQDTKIAATLQRVVDTSGWISSDYHSHSSPSGDNTGSQFGRVLNLLSEHIEFAPCTEHNRIDSYVPHLKRLKAEKLMATCTGMELTGSPLPVNHQNAFPLIHKPHTQDGGAPTTHSNPVAQIERLALWDNSSDKLMQGNHPNLVQILGDRDTNGQADGGFRGMLGFMDVVEVHPPETILVKPGTAEFKSVRRNPIFTWLQMLNLGYRISGVVNTDAHYNFHDTGYIRNYIKSPTDDPAKIDTMEMVHASERGNVIMTNGPFMDVEIQAGKESAIPGNDLVAASGRITLRVHVQCANWYDVNRVQVYLNGKQTDSLNFTRRENPELFGDAVVKFDAKLPIELAEDTHVIVVAAGEGLKMGPVQGPRWSEKTPIAVSNPVFVDVDGGGFQPNGDDLGVSLPIEEGFRVPRRQQD